MAAIKHISAQWLVKMWEYVMDNPQFMLEITTQLVDDIGHGFSYLL